MKLPRTPFRVTLLTIAVFVGGCAEREWDQATFRLNMVAMRKYELDLDTPFTPRQVSDLQDSLTRLFGTPDEPSLPDEETLQTVLHVEQLRMAAGPVPAAEPTTAEHDGAGQGNNPPNAAGGLYRQHCAHCHGITGDGAGPAAEWMDPYPRDFRPGIFQYKSTPLSRKPTDDDLRRIIVNGSPGTAMPAFNRLPDQEVDALVAYVKYLAIRGETERALIDISSDLNAEAGERLDTSDDFLVDEIVVAVAEMWEAASDQVVEVPPRPDIDFATSARLGRDIFSSEVGGCVKCHGPTGLGDGDDTYYDFWTEQLEPSQENRVLKYVALGALPPRPILPHNLRSGVYRGGRRPTDLYWRIRNGIDGTPMPVASMKAPDASEDAAGLTTDQVWHLVDYVRSLPHEAISPATDGTIRKVFDEPPEGSETIFARVTVRQFDWQMQYPGDDGRLDTLDDVYAVNELRLPLGDHRSVVFVSGDVRHRIRIPDQNIQRTLVPGEVQIVRFSTSDAGTLRLLRDPRVGWGHPPVEAKVVIARENESDEALPTLPNDEE